MKRREFLKNASLFGAVVAFGGDVRAAADWRERRDLFPEGVASGDPRPDSVLLWTRRPPVNGDAPKQLTVEIAEDEKFARVVATAKANLTGASDWTCRVLAAGLKPAQVYWYRFTDERGNGSRIGRTVTAPADNDSRTIKFAFVSCQNANQGAQNAYRRMIFEDERAPENDRLGFVLHLGDFIYEIVWYPEDRKQGYYDRTLYDVVRYENGERISDFHVPTTIGDYRAVWRGYLHDPDIQDARARWPFICIWDNHEYSWNGYQSVQVFGEDVRSAQTRKVAANQAWWEYQPARVKKPSGPSLDTFDPPNVVDTPLTNFDANGLSQERNNLLAIASLQVNRTLKYGGNVDLFITDQYSHRSPGAFNNAPEANELFDRNFPYFVPQEEFEIIEAGRSYNGGRPPETLTFGGKQFPNSRRDKAAPTFLGVEQKAWFLDQLKRSRAPWKIWGNSLPTLTWRSDPQNLPADAPKWPGNGYATFGGADWSSLTAERGEIFDAVRDAGITGFTIVAGDRHSFWAGLPSKSLPPKPFDPVGLEFIVGSVSSPGLIESAEHRLPKDVPLRGMYLRDRENAKPEPTMNMLVRHGVRSAIEYGKSGDVAKARALSNPYCSPHLSFVDIAGHGYATVKVTADALETEFVCIERPIKRSASADGGPLRYRVAHRARLWKKGERPKLEQRVIEGDPKLSI